MFVTLKKMNTQHTTRLVKLAKYMPASKLNINVMLNINIIFYCIGVICWRIKSNRGVVMDFIRV